MNQTFIIAKSQADLEKCYPVMHELRPHLSLENYISIYNQAHHNDGYEIVAIEQDQKILAVMGYRVLFDFVRGKHLYIDDLVSTAAFRSQGLGAKLLTYAEEISKELGCASLRLSTGIENENGIRFYERNGWTNRALAYVKKMN